VIRAQLQDVNVTMTAQLAFDGPVTCVTDGPAAFARLRSRLEQLPAERTIYESVPPDPAARAVDPARAHAIRQAMPDRVVGLPPVHNACTRTTRPGWPPSAGTRWTWCRPALDRTTDIPGRCR
jgi:hypothetical protein